ncbi:MAG: hypothetical protein GC201_08085 [Alphaproteobacteria bacterium]|nr:hypothetical protein [Alphaproteobacteria bacterium]
MRFLPCICVAALLGAASPALAQSGMPVALTDAEKSAIENQWADAIAESQRVGRAVFESDRAAQAAAASEAAQGTPDPRIGGWIAEPDGDGFRVLGIGDAGGSPRLLAELRVQDGQAVDGSFSAYPDGRPLKRDEEAAYRARQTAASADFDKCGDDYKAVVLDDLKEGFDVFMLLPMDDRDQVRIGGNAMVHVDKSGRKVLGVQSFSRSCLVLGSPSMPGAPRPFSVTGSDVLAEVPTALHVFLSLQHELPLFILTAKNQLFWRVDGDRIEPEQKYPPSAR